MYSVISYSPKSKIKVETNGEKIPEKQGLKLVIQRMKRLSRLSGIESDEREKRRFVLEFLEKDTKYKLLCDSE